MDNKNGGEGWWQVGWGVIIKDDKCQQDFGSWLSRPKRAQWIFKELVEWWQDTANIPVCVKKHQKIPLLEAIGPSEGCLSWSPRPY